MFDDPVLEDSEVLVVLFGDHEFLPLHAKLGGFVGNISILDFDHVFLVFVDDAQHLPLDLGEMLTHLGLVEEAGLLLEDEVCIGKGLPDRISMSSMFFFFMVEFQWFLMELSVRPGSILVISAHLFPWAVWARNRIHSSWGIHSIFRMLGFRWLCHRYRHCFPSRPSTNLAMKDQRCGPYFSTNFRTRLSSASVQGFFLRNFRDPFSDSRAESFTSSSGIYSSYVFLPIVCSCF